MNATETAYVEELEEKNSSLQDTVKHLQEQLEWLKRHLFGQKSERVVEQVDANQLYLDGFAPTDISTDQGEKETESQVKRKKSGGLLVKTRSLSLRIFLWRRR